MRRKREREIYYKEEEEKKKNRVRGEKCKKVIMKKEKNWKKNKFIY